MWCGQKLGVCGGVQQRGVTVSSDRPSQTACTLDRPLWVPWKSKPLPSSWQRCQPSPPSHSAGTARKRDSLTYDRPWLHEGLRPCSLVATQPVLAVGPLDCTVLANNPVPATAQAGRQADRHRAAPLILLVGASGVPAA